MNWHRDKALIITSAISLILIGVAAFFVIKFGGRFSSATSNLENKQQSIKQLIGDGIEPTQENFEVLETNFGELLKFKEEKIAWLRERQFEPIDLLPIDFTSEVNKRVAGWEALTRKMAGKEAATETNVVTGASADDDARPQDLWGGFENYGRAGRPPDATHVPRLTLQLQDVDMLVKLLLNADVEEVVSITRDTKFETEAEVVPVRPATSDDDDGSEEEEEPPPLYVAEPYTLVFRASEAVVWDALEALSASEHHVTVNKVLFRNENSELQPMLAEGAASKKAPTRASTRSRRPGRGGTTPVGGAANADPYAPKPVAAGLENVFATIDLKVFRFPAPPPEEGEADDADGEDADGTDEAATPAKES